MYLLRLLCNLISHKYYGTSVTKLSKFKAYKHSTKLYLFKLLMICPWAVIFVFQQKTLSLLFTFTKQSLKTEPVSLTYLGNQIQALSPLNGDQQ